MSRAASRRDHQRFCETEGWTEVRNARGKPTAHHITYELTLDDGRVLRTRIFRPASTYTFGPGLWSHVLDDQLLVTQDEFWACVDEGATPSRAGPKESPANTLPAGLAYQLIHALGLREDEVAGLTRDEAIAKMQEHWSRPQ